VRVPRRRSRRGATRGDQRGGRDGADVVIVDNGGRLQHADDLMAELAKFAA